MRHTIAGDRLVVLVPFSAVVKGLDIVEPCWKVNGKS
jgi:hypothetical protein